MHTRNNQILASKIYQTEDRESLRNNIETRNRVSYYFNSSLWWSNFNKPALTFFKGLQCHSLIPPHVREFKAVLDSGFHTLGSGFQVLGSSLFQWNLDSGFQSLVGIRIPWNVFWIPKPRIPNSTSQIFPVFRIQQSKISQIRESWLPYSRPLSAFFILFRISFKTVVLFVLLMTGYILAGWNCGIQSDFT